MPRCPVITLTTDFGTTDFYVAAMKAVLLRSCPDARIIDVTHAVPRHDVTAGSFILERAVASFGPGAVHVAVVDPGVGSGRKILAADVAGSTVICPDNGLITWTARRHQVTAREMTWRPEAFSNTFHGRDVMAPIAGRLASGQAFDFPPVDPILLALQPSHDGRRGFVIYIDTYGNATTNIPAERVDPSAQWMVAGRNVGTLQTTYADVDVGSPIALIGSSDLLEIAVRQGSAAEDLGLHIGDCITRL